MGSTGWFSTSPRSRRGPLNGNRSPGETWARSKGLTAGELLRHVEQELAVLVVDPRDQPLNLFEEAEIFSVFSGEGQFLGRPPLAQVGQRRGFVTLVKKLVERNLQRRRQPLQRFDRRHGMPILHSGDIATQQTRALFDVPLREVFFFSEFFETSSDDHAGNSFIK